MFTAFMGTKWPGKLVAQPSWFDGGTPGIYYDEHLAGGPATCTMTIKADGTFSLVGDSSGSLTEGAGLDWLEPANSHCARHWWVRFTVNTHTGLGSYEPSTGWLQLSSNRVVYSATAGGNAEKFVSYTIEFSPSAGGTPIVQTTGVNLYAYSVS